MMNRISLAYETPSAQPVRLNQCGSLMVSVFDYKNNMEIIGNDEEIELDY